MPTLIDGRGELLLPPLVDSPVHFDKTLFGLPWRPNTADTRNDRIANEQRRLEHFDVPIARRAGPLMEQCIARGTLHTSSHVDAQALFGLRHVEAMLELREPYRDAVDLQLVTLPHAGMLINPGSAEIGAPRSSSGSMSAAASTPPASTAIRSGISRRSSRWPRARESRSTSTCTIPASSAHVSVPPVALLRNRGVNVCSGSDGIRDA